ncbi:MAG: tRNA 2-thiouridine(34) synthase MnmA [Candidatus Syntrophonatronum acetioxidans]|uniref:tRNA-specific 2-thiouridylase MnmA n=1 Tax=Candidatus Syntrophonatronum acetioxidans TaxID=1795816 RepID=A0A424YHR0_9FIRM|nr:MAG: tRNA 2-thiouridine(34) synthase MnmA [Candidatus Syntrophonatronum acetioxidans]
MGEKKKVAVAVSGGVDSSVTAALLQERGYQVFGVTMDLGSPQEVASSYDGKAKKDEDSSLSREVKEGERVCRHLGIPHQVIDLKKDFKSKVINYFIKEYQGGRTPNPCVVCNRHIKFGSLMEEAFSLGAHYLATGHYARLSFDQAHRKYFLEKARDEGKDQTYFLYELTQDHLEKSIFPLGDYLKEEVQELARKWGLPAAGKPESQEICFIEDNDYKGFLLRQGDISYQPGPFYSTSGERLGTHQGLPFYTIGQRKGLGLAVGYPLYVIHMDCAKNAIILGRKEELLARGLTAGRVNYILEEIKEATRLEVKIRYRSPQVEAVLYPLEGGKVRLEFKDPQRAVTPGQAAVFYQGNLLLGGGIIEERLPL